MKKLLIAVLLLSSTTAFAAFPPKNPAQCAAGRAHVAQLSGPNSFKYQQQPQAKKREFLTVQVGSNAAAADAVLAMNHIDLATMVNANEGICAP